MTTLAEQRWMDAITEIGCVVCHALGFPGTPGEVHHLLTDGGRRRGHLDTICLCSPGHHRNARKDTGKISRHPTKALFEATYGTEESLLERSRQLVKERALA